MVKLYKNKKNPLPYKASMSVIPKAPLSFSGTLEEFYEIYARQVLIPPEVMEIFHHQLIRYLQLPDPVFLIRMVKQQIRGKDIFNNLGFRIRPTDNSPAWWLHAQLYTEKNLESLDFTELTELIEDIPCHMFDIKLKEHINHAGWHVAHIFDVKDRNTDPANWSKKELTKRMVRNLHPCNYFYLPKQNWQRYGGEPQVLAFFYEKFQKRYHTIWSEFLSMAEADPMVFNHQSSGFYYNISNNEKAKNNQKNTSIQNVQNRNIQTGSSVSCRIEYEFSRLCFKADLIEPLALDETFCVHTPVGIFRMTKREFYEVFANVVQTKSYQENRIYHYSTTPQKALRFLIN